MKHVINTGGSHNEHGPDREQENHEHGWYREGIERGMEIKVLPELRRKKLNGRVKGSRACYNDTQKCGINRVDVVEMYDVSLLLEGFPQQVTRTEDDDKDKEDDEM